MNDRVVFGLFGIVLATVGAAGPTYAQDRIEPCAAYQAYVSIGSGESAPATALQRVCALIGPQDITQACLTYYTQATMELFAPSGEELDRLAAVCEASMPGGSTLALAGNCRDRDCREPDPILVPEGGTGAGQGDGATCGEEDLECTPPPDPDVIGDDFNDTAGNDAGQDQAGADQQALDLEFWQSIKDSDNPELYRAYLDRFPTGVFAPIARERLKSAGLSDAQDTPMPAPSVLPPIGPDPDGSAALLQANGIMDEAYASDSGDWDQAAALALPLYRLAADKGQGAAWLMLGDLYENGIGIAQDNDQAAVYYQRAAKAGLQEGYGRALLLLDQIGQYDDFTRVFLDYDREAPAAALLDLQDMSLTASQAVQTYLKAKGFYSGAIDGAFGPGSRTALAAFVAGTPHSQVPQPSPQAHTELAAQIQTELARVGCYDGAIDGKWGPASARAMRNFNMWHGDSGETAFATQRGLELVTIALAPVCGVD